MANLFIIKGEQKRIIRRIRVLLLNGFYYFENDRLLRHSFKTIFNVRLWHRTYLVFSKYKIEKNKNLTLKKGNIKLVVAITSQYAYCFYESGNLSCFYWNVKSNYTSFLELINYPTIRPVCFYDNFLLIKTNIIIGSPNTSTKDEYILKNLLMYALTADSKKDGDRVLYLQHGDVKDDNILWINDSDFIFIDLDFIGYKSILYDCIHFLFSRFYSMKSIEDFFNRNKREIRSLLLRFQIEFNSQTIDRIMSEYVMYTFPIDRKKIRKIINENYPITLRTLEKMQDS